MNFDRSQFIGKFTQEAAELVQKLNDGLIRLEKEPHSPPSTALRAGEILKNILRVAHTLKGSSKIMRFQNVSQLAHRMEDLLISIQDGHVRFSDEVFELLFKSVDLMNRGIDEIRRHAEDSIDIEEVCALFDAAVHGEDITSRITQLSQSQTINPKPQSSPHHPSIQETPSDHLSVVSPEQPEQKPNIQETIRVDIGRLDTAIRLVGEMAVSHKRAERALGNLKELQRLARNHFKGVQAMASKNILQFWGIHRRGTKFGSTKSPDFERSRTGL